MRGLGIVIVLLVGLAALQASIKVIVIACLAALFISALLQPMQTFAGLAAVMLMGLLMNYPLIGLPLVVALAIYGNSDQ